jgi:hypothetical protein
MSTGTHAVVANPAALDLLSVTTTQVIPTIPADAPPAEVMGQLIGNPAALADEDCVRCGGDAIHCPICMNCADQCPGHDEQPAAPTTPAPPAITPGLSLFPFHTVAGALVEIGAAFGDFADLVFVERGGLPIDQLTFKPERIAAQATHEVRDGSEPQRCAEVDRLARILGTTAQREPDSELSDWYVAKRVFSTRLTYVAVTRVAPIDPFAGVAWEAERQALAADQLHVDERLAVPGATLPSDSAPVR